MLAKQNHSHQRRTPMPMERPDRTALNQFYGQQSIQQSIQIPRTTLFMRIITLYRSLFGEQNFAIQIVDHKPMRDQSIRLVSIALEAANRLNGRRFSIRYGPGLDLSEEEIVRVLCETTRILKLEEKLGAALAELCLPSSHRNTDETPRD
jgi:hypothetical protein